MRPLIYGIGRHATGSSPYSRSEWAGLVRYGGAFFCLCYNRGSVRALNPAPKHGASHP